MEVIYPHSRNIKEKLHFECLHFSSSVTVIPETHHPIVHKITSIATLLVIWHALSLGVSLSTLANMYVHQKQQTFNF